MDIAPDHSVLVAHDEGHLGVRLETDHAVGDMHPGLLQRLRPGDVCLLIPSSLELDQRHHLLAGLGGTNQRLDDGAGRARGPVQGLLDGEHPAVQRRLVDEGLHRGGERIVGMVDQDIALTQDPEQVGRLLAGALEPALGDRIPRLVLQVGAVQLI